MNCTKSNSKGISLAILVGIGSAMGIAYEIILDRENQQFVSQVYSTNGDVRRFRELKKRAETLIGGLIFSETDPAYSGPHLSDLHKQPPFQEVNLLELLDTHSQTSKIYCAIYAEVKAAHQEMEKLLQNKGLKQIIVECYDSQFRSSVGGMLIGAYSIALASCSAHIMHIKKKL